MLADLCAVCALLPDRVPRLLLLGEVVEGPVQPGLARPAPARPRRLAERPARDQVRAGATRPRRGLRGEVGGGAGDREGGPGGGGRGRVDRERGGAVQLGRGVGVGRGQGEARAQARLGGVHQRGEPASIPSKGRCGKCDMIPGWILVGQNL